MPTVAQEWIRQGRAEGKAEGKVEGKAEGKTEAKVENILIALETRFGPLDAGVVERVRRTAPEHLDPLFRRALTAPSLEAVFDDDWRH